MKKKKIIFMKLYIYLVLKTLHENGSYELDMQYQNLSSSYGILWVSILCKVHYILYNKYTKYNMISF